ncbi:MAG: tetratricopeptide repeat protein [Deltaproteobacteria bacterium]|nr:tetratricopeptide repeat protein [Deltaproteobacteria bacterium]
MNRNKAAILYILFIFISACAASTSKMITPNLIEEAHKHLHQEKYLETIQFLESNLPKDLSEKDRSTESIDLYFCGYNKLALAYLHSGKADKAIIALNKCKQVLPLRSESYYLLGQAYFYVRNFKASIDNFEKGICLDPKAADAQDMSLLMMSYLKIKNREKALETFNTIRNRFETTTKDTEFSESDNTIWNRFETTTKKVCFS